MRALTKHSINSPAAIAAAVALIILFGIVAFYALPVQLFPDIERPQIGIETDWRAQTPREVESQLIEPEEEVLEGIPGLQQMEGHANFGGAYINLTFALGTDMNRALADVVGRLDRVQTLPDDAQKPLAELANTQDPNASLLTIFLLKKPGNKKPINSYEHFIRDEIAPKLQALDGVGSVQFTGSNTTDELQIVFDPIRASELGIQIPKAAGDVGDADDISGGTIDVGRRKYGLSFRGRYPMDDIKSTILDWREGNPVTLGDIADVQIGTAKRQGFAYYNGTPALEIEVFRQAGANVLETVKAIKAKLKALNDTVAKEQDVTFAYTADPAPLVHHAIWLIAFDVFLGIALAIGVLWYFMRDWRATIIVSSAIPICLCAVVILLQLFGRSLNVVSLAGIAVATGLVLDAAIVVLENILRLREAGNTAEVAAHDGTHQVYRALFASTATNVAIFLPVVFLKDVEGQLFADLAITIAFSVLMSLAVALVVVPVATTLFLRTRFKTHELSDIWVRMADRIMTLTSTPQERRIWIAGLIGVSIIGTWLLLPGLHYLPDVKREMIEASFQFSPGATVDFADHEIAQPLINRIAPFATGAKQPQIDNWYLRQNTPGTMTMAIWMKHGSDVPAMEQILRSDIVKNLPDTVGFAREGSLFGGFDEGGGISINIQASDTDAMRKAARKGFDLLTSKFPNAVVTTEPTLDYDEPQLELQPNDRAIAEAGWSRTDVANLVQALGEGLYVGQRFEDGQQLYLILKSQPITSPEALEDIPVVTPNGTIVSLGSIVTFQRTLSASGVYTLGTDETYALNFQPPEGMALGDAINVIRTSIDPQIRDAAGKDGTVTYGAAADHLDNALLEMAGNFAFAVVVLFVIMAAMFRSLTDAAIALIALPLGTVGGVVALRILGLFVFAPLDLLTMIGFIVVLALVVNNTILLVTRTREAEAEGMDHLAAIRSALETRLRPIFSTTLTSVATVLPLVFIPGEGAEIYRGLGAVIIGGVTVSHFFTVFLIPAMMRLGENQLARHATGESAKSAEAAAGAQA